MPESKAELITAVLLAKKVDPTNREAWAKAYREHAKFSRQVLADLLQSYRRGKTTI